MFVTPDVSTGHPFWICPTCLPFLLHETRWHPGCRIFHGVDVDPIRCHVSFVDKPQTLVDDLVRFFVGVPLIQDFAQRKILSPKRKRSVSKDSCNFVFSEEITRKYCLKLANKVKSVAELPAVCGRFMGELGQLKTRDTRSANTIAFEGMSPTDANKARAARAKGVETHAQIQRRTTNYHHRFSKNK